MCELGVLEADPDAVLAQGDAHQQVEQQARQAGSRAEAYGEDREQGDPGADQHERVELVDVEGHRATSPRPCTRERGWVALRACALHASRWALARPAGRKVLEKVRRCPSLSATRASGPA